jgi:hypothetical protein
MTEDRANRRTRNCRRQHNSQSLSKGAGRGACPGGPGEAALSSFSCPDRIFLLRIHASRSARDAYTEQILSCR